MAGTNWTGTTPSATAYSTPTVYPTAWTVALALFNLISEASDNIITEAGDQLVMTERQ